MSLQTKRSMAWSQFLRIQNDTSETDVGTGEVLLGRLVISNANAAVQTVTVKDGTDVVNVIRVPATDTRVVDMNLLISSDGLAITASHADLDIAVLYDD